MRRHVPCAGEMERRTAWATDGVAQGQTRRHVPCVCLPVARDYMLYKLRYLASSRTVWR